MSGGQGSDEPVNEVDAMRDYAVANGVPESAILLDPQVVAATEAQLQHLAADRRARDAEGVADLLRLLGPLTEDEIAARATAADVGAWLAGLHGARRVRLRLHFATANES